MKSVSVAYAYALEKNPFPYDFQLLEAVHISWLMARHHPDPCFHCYFSSTGPNLVVQNDVPCLQLPNLITSERSLLPHKLTEIL